MLRRQADLQNTPRTANYRVAVIHRVLSYGVDHGMRPDNPANRIKQLREGPGDRDWTEAEIDIMTGPAAAELRLPILLALHTAQRQADILHATWSAYDGTTLRIRQRKTGAAVVIPLHPDLIPVLAEARSTNDQRAIPAATICTTAKGQPWKLDHFKHRFAEVRAGLGLPDDLHFHGLRHPAASRLAESGASDAEIQSVTGHKTRAMVA